MNNVCVQVVQHLRPGGIETMALDLQKMLETNSQTHVVSLEGTHEEAAEHWPRLRNQSNLHFLNKAPGFSMGTLWALVKLLRKLKATAVHTHHIGPLMYGGIAARLAGIPALAHTEHDAWHLEQEANRTLEKRLLRWVQPSLIADCPAVADQLACHFPDYPHQVILNGVNTQVFHPADETERREARAQFGLAEDAIVIGCAARLERVKGHRYLLRALALMPEKYQLLLAGDGSQRDAIEALAEQLNIRHRVHMPGALSQMRPFYCAIDRFCLPSENEGLPLSPLEAQACGVPVVVSRVGGCADVVCPHTGQLVAAGDIAHLAHALQEPVQTHTSPRQFVLGSADLERTARAYADVLGMSEPAGA